MAGHSHWKQIQHKKEANDKKRGQVFSKLLKAISAAAREIPDPESNPRLRTAIETARKANVPNDNIERAILRSSEEKQLEELLIEAYGPEKSALLIECLTDNRNRTIAEIKHLLSESGAKFAESGSVQWGFTLSAPGGEWKPNFTQTLSEEGVKKLRSITEALEAHEDVQRVTTNVMTNF